MRSFFLLLLFGSTQVLAQADLSSGLMAYYPFNNNAYDSSGHGNDPSVAKVTYTADRFGNPLSACAFNGKSSYVRIPDHPTLNFQWAYALSAWVMVKGFYEGKCHGNRIIMKGYQDRDNGNYLLTFDDGHYAKGQNCSSKLDKEHQTFYTAFASPVGGKFVVKDKWIHLAVTYDGKNSLVYADGEIIAKGEKEGYVFSNDEDLFFGKLDNQEYPYWFKGLLDEVRIYNRALSSEEINVLAKNHNQ